MPKYLRIKDESDVILASIMEFVPGTKTKHLMTSSWGNHLSHVPLGRTVPKTQSAMHVIKNEG